MGPDIRDAASLAGHMGVGAPDRLLLPALFHGSRQPVLQVFHLYVTHRADCAFGDHPARLAHHRVAGICLGQHEGHGCFGCEGSQFFGLEGLESLRDKLAKRGCTLMVCGLNSQPGSLLFRSGFIDHLGDDNVCPDLSSAIKRAYILLPSLMGGNDEDY